MIRLMLNTGLRLAEVTALKWRDLNLTTGKLMVRERSYPVGRGGRYRPSEEMERAPGSGVRACVHENCKGCPARKGGEVHCAERESVGAPACTAMVKRYAAKAGINKNISPHTLRHSFATDLYRETSKIRLVQKVVHSDLSTTMVYTHIFDEEVESSLKSFRTAKAVATV